MQLSQSQFCVLFIVYVRVLKLLFGTYLGCVSEQILRILFATFGWGENAIFANFCRFGLLPRFGDPWNRAPAEAVCQERTEDRPRRAAGKTRREGAVGTGRNR